MQYYDVITNPRWRTATVMKIILSAYLGEKWYDYDEICCTESDNECERNDLTKIQFFKFGRRTPYWTRKLCYRKDDHISRSWAVAEIWPFKIIQDGRHLEFVRTVNSAIPSADPENPTLEPNMKWIGSPVAEIWPFAYLGVIWNPILGGRRGRRGQRWHH